VATLIPPKISNLSLKEAFASNRACLTQAYRTFIRVIRKIGPIQKRNVKLKMHIFKKACTL